MAEEAADAALESLPIAQLKNVAAEAAAEAAAEGRWGEAIGALPSL